MKARWWFVVPAIAAAVSGMYLSYTLLAKHMHFSGAPDWLSAMCESGESGNISCDTVLASDFGMFPPIREGDPKDKFRVPVALIGLMYFTAMFVWLLAVGRVNRAGRWWHALPLLVNGCALVGSIGFIKIMATDLSVWCPLCVGTHVANLVLFVSNVLLWPRRPRGTAEDAPEPGILPHPTTRLAIVAGAMCLVAAQLEMQMASVAGLSGVNKKLTAAMEEIRSDVGKMISAHMAGEKHTIEFRNDDPVRHRASHVPTLVVWSDFECGSCRKFAGDFEASYHDDFKGRLQVVYKHYPLSSDCNPYAKIRAHPHACDAAKLSEAIRIVGGNDKFWEAHDIFFAAGKTLGQLDAHALASQLGLDADRLIEAMNSDEVAKRIAEDVEQAKRLGVRSTPTVFVNGRLINSWARTLDDFWKGLGALYNRGRPAKATHAKDATTGGNATH